MKFIHLTDTHLVASGGDLYGTNPKARMQQAVAHICAHHADASALMLTGDLTHLGHAEAYAHVKECLAPLPMPVYPILGNHDNRQNFRACFPGIEDDGNGFIQYTRMLDGYLGIFLDTHEPGAHWGSFCDQRAEWLKAQLDSSNGPVLLFMHHPFFPVGIATMDSIALRDAAPFLQAIQGHETRIRHLFFGHIHRPICGSANGIPFSTLRGTNHQVSLVLGGAATDDIVGSHEPPQYGIVLLAPERVVIHTEDYLDCNLRFPLHAWQA